MPAAQPHNNSSKKPCATHPPPRKAAVPAAPPQKAAPVAPQATGAPGAPKKEVFSEAVFGARLARALDALLAMQRADAAQIARGPRGPLSALFTTPTGPSLFEADSLTLHFLCGGVSLAALVAHHRGALPHVAEALDGLEISDVRALLWALAADGAPSGSPKAIAADGAPAAP